MATKLPFLKDRKAVGAWIVLRLDNYHTAAANRGQYYPKLSDKDTSIYHLPGEMRSVAVWPTEKQALAAAAWDVEQFGNEYGIFRLSAYVKAQKPVVKLQITRVRA